MKPEFSKKASKFISAQDRPTKGRIRKAINKLLKSPPEGNIKLLQGYDKKTFRLRVGKFRIIFTYETDNENKKYLYIADVDSRGDIYK